MVMVVYMRLTNLYTYEHFYQTASYHPITKISFANFISLMTLMAIDKGVSAAVCSNHNQATVACIVVNGCSEDDTWRSLSDAEIPRACEVLAFIGLREL